MNGIEKAQEALIKSQGHVLVHGRTGPAKSKLLEETIIPDSRYFDFVKMCKSTCYFDLPFLCSANEGIYLDDILEAKESTVILDSVEFPQNIHDSFLYDFLKTMSARGKRVIAVALNSDTLENFKPVFEYEIETLRLEDGSFTCTTTSKTGSVELLLKNRFKKEQIDVKKQNSTYETLEVECYMASDFIGLHVLDHLERKNGEPLLIVFPEFERKTRGQS